MQKYIFTFILLFATVTSPAQPLNVGRGVVSINYTSNGQEDSIISLYKKQHDKKPFYCFIIREEDEKQSTGKKSPLSMLEFMPTPGRMIFRCVDTNSTMYCIVINEITHAMCWIKKSQNIEFADWLSYFKDADMVACAGPVYEKPSTNSSLIPEMDSCHDYNVLRIEGEWMEVGNSWHCYVYKNEPITEEEKKGWIRWRNDATLLVSRGYSE